MAGVARVAGMEGVAGVAGMEGMEGVAGVAGMEGMEGVAGVETWGAKDVPENMAWREREKVGERE
jgi:hypothetical protein